MLRMLLYALCAWFSIIIFALSAGSYGYPVYVVGMSQCNFVFCCTLLFLYRSGILFDFLVCVCVSLSFVVCKQTVIPLSSPTAGNVGESEWVINLLVGSFVFFFEIIFSVFEVPLFYGDYVCIRLPKSVFFWRVVLFPSSKPSAALLLLCVQANKESYACSIFSYAIRNKTYFMTAAGCLESVNFVLISSAGQGYDSMTSREGIIAITILSTS